MEKEKRGRAGIISALFVILGSIIFVSATLTNSTENSFTISFNESLNITFVALRNNETISEATNTAIPLNETAIDGVTSENQTNESVIINGTINLPIPAENLTLINQSNLTVPINNTKLINVTLPEKPIKNLTEIVEKHKNKLNSETEDYFKNIKDKKEEKEFIIKFRNSIDESKLSNVTLEKKIDRFKLTKINGKIEDIEGLIEDAEIEFMELEQNTEILEENIPFNIKKVKADSVWNLSNGSGIRVAVLDTGIDSHSDLSIAGGYSVVSADYNDNNGHGTSVSGVIAALSDNEGLIGVSPAVDLYTVKIMESSSGSLSDAIAGVEWAIDNNMDIISMSFGIESYSQIFKEVLQEAYDNGILLVAASGNGGTDNILYPAKYSSVIAVGATNENDDLASFSSYGFEQELVAPGVDINSTDLGNGYNTASGTSMSAPHVTGVAALIKSFNKSLTNIEIRNKLRNDALDLGEAGKDDMFGYGLVQINLEVFNFTQINESYFYEVFNVSNYRFFNETLIFWLSGTGTIDDVNYQKGIYFINITFNNGSINSNYYNVSENRSIFILAASISHSDNFSIDGSSSDGILWLAWDYQVKISEMPGTTDAECYDTDLDWTDVEYCFAATTNDMNSCEADFSEIDCSSTICDDSASLGVFHSILDTSVIGTNSTRGVFYVNCVTGTPERNRIATTKVSYFIDTKRTRCLNDSDYVVEGYYSNGNWVEIRQSTCSQTEICSNDLINITDPGKTIESGSTDPCVVANVCTGTIAAIATDSKSNQLSGLKVYSNGVQQGTTDLDGSKEISISDSTCGSSNNVTIKCSDDTTCDSKFTSVDTNGDYDSLSFTCNVCINKTDLSIKTSDVTIKSQGNKYNITALINVEKVSANNVQVYFRGENIKQDFTLVETKIININPYQNQNVSVLWDLNKTYFVSVFVDFSNVVAEVDESNNYVRKAARPATKAYVDVSTDYAVLNAVYSNFLDDYIDLVSEANAEVKIYIGRKNSNIPRGLQTTDKKNWKFENNIITFTTKSEGLPYNGLAVKQNNNIYIIGNEIDGELAALRKLVDNQEFYFSKAVTERIDYISEEDLDGLFVFDYLHTDENQAKYRKNNANFAKVVENVLNSDVSTLAIKRVLTTNDNTSLRIKHINAELSPKFQQFSNSQPVVLARGLWSNLFTWERFGFEIARGVGTNKPRDTWLIEITGGPNTECATCPNYRFSDLTQYYWPALISGVQAYSNKTNISYVGFSNGCRTALSSLELYNDNGKANAGYYNNGSDWILTNLSKRPIDTFVGVGCTGAFDHESAFKTYFGKYGQQIINRAISQNFTHFSEDETGKRLMEKCQQETNFYSKGICLGAANGLQGPDSNGTISMNLNQDYLNWILNSSDIQPGLNVKINHTKFIAGYSHFITGYISDSDGVVSRFDINDINDGIISGDKSTTELYASHHGQLSDGKEVQDSIKKYINK